MWVCCGTMRTRTPEAAERHGLTTCACWCQCVVCAQTAEQHSGGGAADGHSHAALHTGITNKAHRHSSNCCTRSSQAATLCPVCAGDGQCGSRHAPCWAWRAAGVQGTLQCSQCTRGACSHGEHTGGQTHAPIPSPERGAASAAGLAGATSPLLSPCPLVAPLRLSKLLATSPPGCPAAACVARCAPRRRAWLPPTGMRHWLWMHDRSWTSR